VPFACVAKTNVYQQGMFPCFMTKETSVYFTFPLALILARLILIAGSVTTLNIQCEVRTMTKLNGIQFASVAKAPAVNVNVGDAVYRSECDSYGGYDRWEVYTVESVTGEAVQLSGGWYFGGRFLTVNVVNGRLPLFWVAQ
jgi:hypothetical protein